MTTTTRPPLRRPARRRGSNRREFLATGGGTLAAVSLFGLAGCGGDGDSTGKGPIVSVASSLGDFTRTQVRAFNAAHPDLPAASVRIMPEDTDQYFGQLRTQFQAGGNDISVIAGDVIWPSQLAEPGWIADLSARFTEQMRSEFLPGAVAAMTYKDGIFGVPWYTDSGLLYYRQDLLENAGYSEPPKTWDELAEMSAKVTRDSKVKNGLVFTGARYEGGTVLGTEFIRNAGGDILDGEQVVIGSPQAIRGLETQRSLVEDGVAPKAVASFKEDEASGAFLRGDVVFMRMWPYAYDLLSDPEQSSLETAQVGLAQVPVAAPENAPVNVGGGWNFYLNAATADADAAFALIEFLSGPGPQKQLALDSSLLPTRKAVYDDREVLDKLPAVKLGKDAILTTTTPPVSPYYADMSLAMAEEFNANILGSTSPEDAAASLQDKLESIIERGG